MIFYFTSSGNSFIIAKKIGAILNERLISISENMKINLFSDKKYIEYEIDNNECIGFVFPVHCFGVPNLIIEFLKKVKFINYKNQYVFGIVTYGSNYGNSCYEFSNSLNEICNININYLSQLKMPMNCILLSNPENISDQKNKIKKSLDIFDSIIIEDIILKRNSKTIKNNTIYNILNKVMKKVIYKIYSPKNFNVLNSCVSCSLCYVKCPKKVIKIDTGRNKPLWVNIENCNFCLACIQNCPKNSIQYGSSKKHKNQSNIIKSYIEEFK